MMCSVTLQGRLSTDVTLRTTKNGDNVASFSVCYEPYKKDPVFMNVSIWGKTGERFAEYHKKGDWCVLKDFEFQMNKWTGSDGIEHKQVILTNGRWAFSPGNKKKEESSVGVSTTSTLEYSDDEIPF